MPVSRRSLRGAALGFDLRADHEITPEQLFVRGAGVCLATVGRDVGEVRVLAEHDDGWYDTGDLVVPDGRGGIRIISRASDRIGGAFMIPIKDVETELLDHPAVLEVALVGYADGSGGELACAYIVGRSELRPLIAELRAYLTSRGMTDWYQPSRAEYVEELPRNASGKVQKDLLRKRLQEPVRA
jgi:cyclohexanecarboxylate-CoA ligase